MMWNAQKLTVSAPTSAYRKKQTHVFLLNDDDEVSISNQKMLNTIYQKVISICTPRKHDAKGL